MEACLKWDAASMTELQGNGRAGRGALESPDPALRQGFGRCLPSHGGLTCPWGWAKFRAVFRDGVWRT